MTRLLLRAATLLCLTSTLVAAPINFSNITSTNAVKTNDVLLVNTDQGGGTWATRTATIANFKTTGGFQQALDQNSNITVSNITSKGSLALSGQSKALTVSGGSLLFDGSPVGGGSGAWTSNSGFLYPAGTALSNTAPITVRSSDGSVFIGTNVWSDVSITGTTHAYPLYSTHYTNQHTQVSAGFRLIDDPGVFDKYATIGFNLGLSAAGVQAADVSISSGSGATFRDLSLSANPLASPIKYQIDFADAFAVDDSGAVTSVSTIGGSGFIAGAIPGITTTWTNLISGVITQRITAVGGIIVTNLTLP